MTDTISTAVAPEMLPPPPVLAVAFGTLSAEATPPGERRIVRRAYVVLFERHEP
ncbi:hypothetical protein ABCR94_00605 [Streptomyces sp. 21So2-11]|uniref:hypothetical protein n=1 Tax=Streptomyces sp. 21So2-11 TaxID=3144408 RepID=UPI00321AC6F4